MGRQRLGASVRRREQKGSENSPNNRANPQLSQPGYTEDRSSPHHANRDIVLAPPSEAKGTYLHLEPVAYNRHVRSHNRRSDSFSRREWLRLAQQFGLGALAAASAPSAVRAAISAASQGQAVATSAAGLSGKDPRLIARSVRPPDFETPVALLDTFLTPNEHFYVRSHMPPPAAADAAAWKLAVEGEVAMPLSLSLADLEQFPETSVTATLECAGNGRAFFDPPVAGIQWEKGAVGTARWTGVRMADVLRKAGVKPSSSFVTMNGADQPVGTMPDFVRQLPIGKAMHADTLIARSMNGQPLPAAHGFPLRVIVPGWEGAYAVKWLNEIRVLSKEFDGFWVATGYRYPVKRVAPGASVDASDLSPLTGLAVKSLITKPLSGSVVPLGAIDVAGFAWAGDSPIAGVEISTDSGATWKPARLTGERVPYAWRRFEFRFDARKAETLTVMSRATDVGGRTQPAIAHWNPSGYLWNQPDAIRVEVKS